MTWENSQDWQLGRAREPSRLPEQLPHAFELYLDALTGQQAPLVTAREAARRSAVMEALYAAARQGSWVACSC